MHKGGDANLFSKLPDSQPVVVVVADERTEFSVHRKTDFLYSLVQCKTCMYRYRYMHVYVRSSTVDCMRAEERVSISRLHMDSARDITCNSVTC